MGQQQLHALSRSCLCSVAWWFLTLCNPMDCSPPRPLGPWNFPGKNTGAGCRFLLQGIFPAQGSNPHILCTHIGRQVFHHCANLEAPKPSQHSLNHPRPPQLCWINDHRCPHCPQHCFREGFLETDSEMDNRRLKVYLGLLSGDTPGRKQRWQDWAEKETDLPCGCNWWLPHSHRELRSGMAFRVIPNWHKGAAPLCLHISHSWARVTPEKEHHLGKEVSSLAQRTESLTANIPSTWWKC